MDAWIGRGEKWIEHDAGGEQGSADQSREDRSEAAGRGREKEKQWIERQEVAVADRPSSAVVRERPDEDVHQHSTDNGSGGEPLP